MTVSDLFKKFRCCKPAPVLPTTQIQTTSFTYQLAFVQWGLEYLLQSIEGYEERTSELETRATSLERGITQLQEAIDPIIVDIEDLDDRVTALENGGGGGGVTIETGSGNIVDILEGGAGIAGTYDYSILGNLLTVTLHVERTPVTTALSLKLDGLSKTVTPGNQRFGYVFGNYGNSDTHSFNVMFYTSNGSIFVSAVEAGVAYASNFAYLNDATFTMRIS